MGDTQIILQKKNVTTKKSTKIKRFNVSSFSLAKWNVSSNHELCFQNKKAVITNFTSFGSTVNRQSCISQTFAFSEVNLCIAHVVRAR